MSQGATSLDWTPLAQRLPSAIASAVPDAEREQLLSEAVRVRDYARGDLISNPGSHAEDAFLLDRGYVRLYRLAVTGTETTLRIVGPRELFGSVPQLGVAEDRCFAVALCPSTVARIPRVALERLLRTRPQLVLALGRQIGNRLRRIEDRVESLAVCGALRRVAECLLGLAEEFGQATGEAIVLDVPLTQEELSTLVGMTRQTMNASLGSLRAQGLVETTGNRIRLDPCGLRNLTGAGREDGSAPVVTLARTAMAGAR